MTKFKAILDNPELLRDSLSVVSAIINEGVFKFSKNGIVLKSMDPANVSLVDLTLLASAFRSFEIDNETEIGLNLSDLTSVLKRAKATDSVTLELKGNVFGIDFSGSTKRSFNIPVLELKQDTKTPNLEFSSVIKLKSPVLEDGISDAEIVSDAIVIEASPESFSLRAKNESRKSELILSKNDDALIELNSSSSVKSMFPLDYLKKISKGSKLSPECILSLGNEYPLKVDFTVIDKMKLSFILAPRIESE